MADQSRLRYSLPIPPGESSDKYICYIADYETILQFISDEPKVRIQGRSVAGALTSDQIVVWRSPRESAASDGWPERPASAGGSYASAVR
jgi:hypothetical protein